MVHTELMIRLPFFKEFTPKALESIALRLFQRDYWESSIVFKEGEEKDEMYFILNGRVDVLWEIGKKRRIILESIGPGDIFGEIASLLDITRSATIMAVEDLETLALGHYDFLSLLEEDPKTAFFFLKALGRNLSHKLRSLNQRLLFAESTLATLVKMKKPKPYSPGKASPETMKHPLEMVAFLKAQGSVKILKDIHSAKTLDPDVLEILKKYGEHSTCDTGKVLIHEGGIQHDFYLILDGLVEVSKNIGTDERIILVHLGPGSLVGEMAFLDSDLRSAEVRALEPIELYVFHGQKIKELISHDPKLVNRIYLTIIRHLCSNIMSTNSLYISAKRKLLSKDLS